jgi:anthranilate phosphoribosyltransferase
MVVGVNDVKIMETYAKTLHAVGVKRALVVRGREGLDEVFYIVLLPIISTFQISPTTETDVVELRPDGSLTHFTLSPSDFGIEPVNIKDICGGDPKHNLETLMDFLDGKLPPDHPIVSFVLVNAAALLTISGRVDTFLDGMATARESLTSGRAKKAFQDFCTALANATVEEK